MIQNFSEIINAIESNDEIGLLNYTFKETGILTLCINIDGLIHQHQFNLAEYIDPGMLVKSLLEQYQIEG